MGMVLVVKRSVQTAADDDDEKKNPPYTAAGMPLRNWSLFWLRGGLMLCFRIIF